VSAAFADRSLTVMPDARVLDWACASRVEVRGGSLPGTVVADEIAVFDTCEFSRLHATSIRFGAAERSMPTVWRSNAVLDALPGDRCERRIRARGDYEISGDEVMHGDVVVRGMIRVGRGASVHGSLKASRVVLESGVLVTGSVFARTELTVAPGCHIHGVVAVDRLLKMAGGTVGLPGRPASVSAQFAEISGAAVIHGELIARDRGIFGPSAPGATAAD
jgi:cytoskeletal protein CcmA (bactofilin family)